MADLGAVGYRGRISPNAGLKQREDEPKYEERQQFAIGQMYEEEPSLMEEMSGRSEEERRNMKDRFQVSSLVR